jgi:predicted secreted hydrolase
MWGAFEALGGGVRKATDAVISALPKGPFELAPPDPVDLPHDDAAHKRQFYEWWQWWPHVTTPHGQRFGLTLEFLGQFSALNDPRVWRVDWRVTDVTNGASAADAALTIERNVEVENGFDFASCGQSAVGGGGHDRIEIRQGADRFVLEIAETRPPVPLFAPEGYVSDSRFPGQFLCIYQRQRMRARGTWYRGGAATPVEGTAWFEHGRGNLLGFGINRSDYAQLELEDGRDIVVAHTYLPRVADVVWLGQISDGTSTQYLSHKEGEFDIQPAGAWKRDATCTYPGYWNVRVRDENFVVTPTYPDQEIPGYPVLWDGEARITGDATGWGVAHARHYCEVPARMPSVGTIAPLKEK